MHKSSYGMLASLMALGLMMEERPYSTTTPVKPEPPTPPEVVSETLLKAQSKRERRKQRNLKLLASNGS